MKRSISLTCLVIAAAGLLAAPLAAQDRTGTWEITPFAGGHFGGRLDAGSNALFARDVDLGTAPTYGVRLGFNVNRWFGMEFGWSHAKPDIRAIGGDVLFGQGQKLGEMTHNVFEGNAVFNMARGQFIPYLTLGAGAMTFDAWVPDTPSATDTRFVASFGGGVKMFVTPRVALRIDGRYRSAYINNNDNFHRNGSNWYGSGEVTGGLTFAFGR
jgi:opacity protein-like surface antigen